MTILAPAPGAASLPVPTLEPALVRTPLRFRHGREEQRLALENALDAGIAPRRHGHAPEQRGAERGRLLAGEDGDDRGTMLGREPPRHSHHPRHHDPVVGIVAPHLHDRREVELSSRAELAGGLPALSDAETLRAAAGGALHGHGNGHDQPPRRLA